MKYFVMWILFYSKVAISQTSGIITFGIDWYFKSKSVYSQHVANVFTT